MHRSSFLFVFLLLTNLPGFAQTKRPLTHADYDRWQSVRAEKISGDGRWISYQIDPQEGDGMLELRELPHGGNRNANAKYSFPRGYQAQFSHDSRFLVMRLKVPHAITRTAKRKKVKAEQMPKDSLLVFDLNTRNRTKLPNVKSYLMGKEGSSWLAILQEINAGNTVASASVTVQPGAKSDSIVPAPNSRSAAAAKPKTTTKKPKGDLLTLLNMADGTRQTFRYVSNVVVSENGRTFFYSKEAVNDSLKTAGVYLFDTQKQAETLIDTSSLRKVYKGLAIDKAGTQLAWMATTDSAGAEAKVFALYYKSLLPPAPAKSKRTKVVATAAPFRLLVDTTTASLPKGWTVNEFTALRFSENGQRLYFATAPKPVPAPKDTLTPDDEKVKMDVWSWTDNRLQPMQQKRLKQEKEQGFTTVFDVVSGRVTQLATREIPTVQVDYKTNQRYLVGLSDLPYQIISSWDPGHTDLYLIDTETGKPTKIANDAMISAPRLSPGGQYVTWYDERDSLWRAWSVRDNKRIDLTRGLPAKFFDEEHDTPNLPGSYGAAGWTTGDRYVWLYDRYDIWQIDPTGREKPVNLTAGYGRKNKIQIRRADLSDGPTDEQGISPSAELWLTGYWESDKSTGILKKKGNDLPAEPTVLTHSSHRYVGLAKAKNASTLTFYRGNFREPVNLYATDTTLATPVQLTRVNPQQDSIRWGSVELVNWMGNNGVQLEGLLYKPEDFDPKKKYPMLVYYYERNNQTLNDYRAPAPSRSTINIPYCISNGYLVFVPDIVYTTGAPGPNAYDCIVPGVLNLIDRGFVDRERIGLQGQSWGGYQTAYIITRTNMFKAAMAGAPVANMTSAYGGIRWGTGMSRMFQYERTQSRIGGTLWDKPLNYIENSPLFYANRITTPLLMMHNDADGSVPWYQGIEMFTALRRLNKPVWMLVYNGEDHNLTQRHNAKDLSIRMYQFFDYYLKDTPAPVWMTEGRSAVEKDRGEMKY
ncbi:prolyl oligopeptidase family serine peptidase [Nibrella saemangeumensis]|uniref:Prolyl oligopeptidase family serine peptidase n=1 Tax=Nibrella saemangeumensis TaxID=1084526 RepID=A0ABP8NGA9_9BACT